MNEDTYRDKLTDLQLEVEALRAQLKESQTGDLISRQAAIDRIRGTGYADQIKENIIMILMCLPSAQPEPCEDAVSRNAIIQNLRGR